MRKQLHIIRRSVVKPGGNHYRKQLPVGAHTRRPPTNPGKTATSMLLALLLAFSFPVPLTAFAQPNPAADDAVLSQTDESTAAPDGEDVPATQEETTPPPNPAQDDAPPVDSGTTDATDDETDTTSDPNDLAQDDMLEVTITPIDDAVSEDGIEGIDGEIEALEESSEELTEQEEATIAPLAVGDLFQDASDEGVAVYFKITSPTTVQVGSGTLINTQDGDLDTLPVTVDPNYAGTVSIPATVSHEGVTYTVTAVGDSAFCAIYSGYRLSYRVSAVRLPNTITSIGSTAFWLATSLTAVEFPYGSSVTSIGNQAFMGTSSLTSFTMPSSVTALGGSGTFRESALQSITFEEPCQIVQIPGQAFYSTPLASFDFPSSVTSVEYAAFSGSLLTSVSIPARVTHLGENVFSGCTSLESAVLEPGSPLTELSSGLFNGCTALSDFQINSTITSIAGAAFQGSGLTSIYIPTNVTYLGRSAFASCRYLASVVFEDGHQMLSFSERVFSGCIQLEAIDLPKNLHFMGDYTFMSCTALQAITIPASVVSLGTFTFQGCTALSTVVFAGDASALSCDYSVFYLCNSIAKVVYEGKKSRAITFISSQPTFFYTIAFYASRADLGSTPLALYSVQANDVPASASGDSVFQGAIPALDPDYKWVYEEGYFITSEITDSYYAYAHSRANDLVIDQTFTANTVEGIPVTYTVTGLPSGNDAGQATVGSVLGPAIALATTGSITLPSIVVGPDGQRYTVTAIAGAAFRDCNRFVAVTIPPTVTNLGSYAFQRCAALRRVNFEGDVSQVLDLGIFMGCANIEQVVFGGKKATLSFGVSSPAIYYTVRYYESEHDFNIGNILATVIVLERTLLGTTGVGQIYSGTIPTPEPGFSWKYEEGFGLTIPLTDSTVIYSEGQGFKAGINLENGGSTTTVLCWFKILSFDEGSGTGTVMAGLGVKGVTAIPQSAVGTPVIPATVEDDAHNRYTVVGISDYAFGSTDYYEACPYLPTVKVANTVTTIGVSAFERCQGLTHIDLPASVATLGEAVFRACAQLRTFTIDPAAPLKVIPSNAFYDDQQLVTFDFPHSLERIQTGAFYACQAMTWLEIPASFKQMDNNAFPRCYHIRDITFLGDASHMNIEFQDLDWSLTVSSQLARVYYNDKKYPNLAPCFWPYSNSGMPQNEYGRNWYQYFNIKFYRSKTDFLAGSLYDSVMVREDLIPTTVLPSPGVGRTWVSEPGFSVYSRATNSFYAFAGADIGEAIITGIDSQYSYTGEYLKPTPTLTMPDGTVLRLGVDYTFDTTQGLNRDGYVNNRRQGTASVNLVGAGDYAGTASKTFEIVGTIDTSASMKVDFLGRNSYVYSGSAITPQVQVTVTFRGETRAGVAGTDYRISYLNNVDSNQKRGGTPAQVVVTGLGIFGGTYAADFTINPFPLSRCDVTGTVTTSSTGAVSDPRVTVVNAMLDKTLKESEDYQLQYNAQTFSRSSTIYVVGQGNYTGTRRIGFEVSSGTGGGGGGGDGTGIGTGNGPGFGNGDGTASDASGLGGTDAAVVATEGGGGGNGGARPIFSINEIVFDEIPEVIEGPSPLTVSQTMFWLLAVALLVAGAAWHLRSFFIALDKRRRDDDDNTPHTGLSPA